MHRSTLLKQEQEQEQEISIVALVMIIVMFHSFSYNPVESYNLITNHLQQVVCNAIGRRRINGRFVPHHYSHFNGCTFGLCHVYPIVPSFVRPFRRMESAIHDTTFASCPIGPTIINCTTTDAKEEPTNATGSITAFGSGKVTEEEAVHMSVLPVRPFPMELIVDQSIAKEALLLCAVNPNIHGLAIGGRRGTGKTVLARCIRSLLPPIAEAVPCPFVDVPLNVMEDSLVGTIDLEQSLEAGQTVFSPGLLARAHNGVLHVDDINLLEDEAANVLLNVVNEGWVHVEREGLSVRYPCQPCLFVATYNPEEAEFRQHLQDRVGIALTLDTSSLSVPERVDAVDHVIGFTTTTVPYTTKASATSSLTTKTLQTVEEHENKMKQRIIESRERLQRVRITRKQIQYLCEEATRADCEGQRGEIYAAEIAKASAAFHGREFVNAEDLQKAVLLAIAPRARTLESTLEGEGEEDPNKIPDMEEEDDLTTTTTTPPTDKPSETQQLQEEETELEEDEDQQKQQQQPQLEEEDDYIPEEQEEMEQQLILEVPQEFMFGVTSTPINPKLMAFAGWAKKGRAGKGSRIFNFLRGRFVKAVFPKGGKKGKIAVGATLRASAPYQKNRRLRAIGTKREWRMVHIQKDDFRIQKMAKKAGTLVIFCVDASGSMALNRMNAAKGAAISLLTEAYKHRDKICLISFRETTAEVLVPPTKSITMTKSRLESMPCGGGSPLSHGLMTSMRVGLNAKKIKKDVGQVVIVCITDGRANIPMSISLGIVDPTVADSTPLPSRTFLKEEVMECARRLAALPDFNFLVIDTEDKFVGTGFGEELARVGKGNYHHLVETNTNAVEQITRRNLETIRK
jgi:magnesium chelatase subunit D